MENDSQMRFHGKSAIVTACQQITHDRPHISVAEAGISKGTFRANHVIFTRQGSTVFDMDINHMFTNIAIKFP
jgi:hypothetical protein